MGRMEGKPQRTAVAMAGISERPARKRQCGPLPPETRQRRVGRPRAEIPSLFPSWAGRVRHRTGQRRSPMGAAAPAAGTLTRIQGPAYLGSRTSEASGAASATVEPALRRRIARSE